MNLRVTEPHPWELLKPADAAVVSGVDDKTIRLACANGTLPAFDRGRGSTHHWRIRFDSLVAWMESGCPTDPAEVAS